MLPSSPHSYFRLQVRLIAATCLAVLLCALSLQAESTYIRVNQAGYEAASAPFRAYVMSKDAITGATFAVINSQGVTADSGKLSAPQGLWSHSKTVTFNVYALAYFRRRPSRDALSRSAPEHALLL